MPLSGFLKSDRYIWPIGRKTRLVTVVTPESPNAGNVLRNERGRRKNTYASANAQSNGVVVSCAEGQCWIVLPLEFISRIERKRGYECQRYAILERSGGYDLQVGRKLLRRRIDIPVIQIEVVFPVHSAPQLQGYWRFGALPAHLKGGA